MKKMLIICAILIFTVGNVGAQVTITGGPNNGNSYLTIQAAINDCSGGETINVAAGTYNERPVVNKSVTIIGANEATVIVDAGAATSGSYGFYVTADNVSISNLTLIGNPVSSTPRYGFKVSSVSNFTLFNVTAKEFYRTAVDLLGVNTGVLTNITSIDNNGHGLALVDCNNVTLTNMTLSGNAWQNVSVATWGEWSPLGTSSIVFNGTNSFGDLFQLEMGDYNNPGVPPAGDAIITYSTNVLDGADVTVQASDFGFALHGEQDDSPDQVRIWFISTLANAAIVPALAPIGHWTGNAMYIESLTDGTQFYITPGCTIQAAIDAASAGDVINVAAGTYPEQLLITKALTINGADGAILDGTTLGDKIVGVKIKSGDVTFNNVDLANFSGNGIIVGYEAPIPGSLKNVHITNCKISGIQPGYSHGFGIYVGYESEAFKNSSKLTEHLDYSGLLIENNEITDSKSSSVVLQSITGTPGTLVVRNNNIHDNDNDGIWIDCARNIVIENNIVKGNLDGIYISSYGDGSDGEWDGIPHLNGPYGPKDIQITGNQIIDNISYGGIYLESGWPATISINGNTITGNAPEGLANYLAEEVNATCNWWGDVSGPTHNTNPGGSGDDVTDNVMFLPWLLTSDLDGSCIGGTPLGNKLGVLGDLADLDPSGDKKTDDRIKKAIKHINKSLDDKLWEDGYYLTKKGKKVFDEEKKAVKELNKIVKEKKHDLLKSEAQEAIDKLVVADQALAQIMIDKAIAESGDSKEIERAEKEMGKAQEEMDKAHYDHAIDKYKKAWEHAYKALKKVGALGKYSTATDELAVTTTPEKFSLGDNYPNPFNPTTLISYNLPEASQVTMTVYDLMGRKVKTLVQGFQPAGNHSVLWNATNDNGAKMSGGMYFYQIRAGSFQQTHKMILLK